MILIAPNNKTIASCTAGTAVATEVRRRHEEYVELPRFEWSGELLWSLWSLRAFCIFSMSYLIVHPASPWSSSSYLIGLYWMAFLIDMLVR